MSSIGDLVAKLRAVIASLPEEELIQALDRAESGRTIIIYATAGSSAWEPGDIIAKLGAVIDGIQDGLHLIRQTKDHLEAYIAWLLKEGSTASTSSGTNGATSGSSASSSSAPSAPPAAGATPPAGSAAPPPTPKATKPPRTWKTIAEEEGGVRSFPNYAAAKRVLGSRPGQEIHHLVERAQCLPHRSQFSTERVNTTDNMVWLPKAVHKRVSAEYSSKLEGGTGQLRNTFNGVSWDRQYRYGQRAVDRAFQEQENYERALRDHDST